MDEKRIFLAAIWIALMLTYLLGDVLRLFSGDFKAGEMGGKPASRGLWMLAAALMLLPILMILLTLGLPQPVSRWVNIGMAAFFFLFNIIGLPTYPSMYDKFLIVVGLGMNALTVWQAWNWACPVTCSGSHAGETQRNSWRWKSISAGERPGLVCGAG